MYSKFYSPNIIATGSSAIDQSSYSHHADNDVGVAVIDRWTYYILEFLETQVLDQNSKKTLGDLFDSYDESKIHSQPGLLWDLYQGGEQRGRERLVMDFFGNVQNVEVDGRGGMNLTAWREDLEDIERFVRAMQKANATGSASMDELSEGKTSQPISQIEEEVKDYRRPWFDMEKLWSKQMVGSAILLGGITVWLAGSMMGTDT
jgi:phosphatidylinositol glycan class K